MQIVRVEGQPAGNALVALVAEDGTAGHPFARVLMRGDASPRDLSDVVHHLCMLHGRHPGVIEHARAHPLDADGADWLDAAAAAFAAERANLVALVAAAGPLPSTPGQAETEAAVIAQRNAAAMLAQSDRPGCAFGTAMALVLDWQAVRRVLDAGAAQLGLALSPARLPAAGSLPVSGSRGVERALLFGAQQLLAQHRGLWDLLETRAEARGR